MHLIPEIPDSIKLRTAAVQTRIDQAVRALSAAAVQLSTAHKTMWSGSDAELIDYFNAIGPVQTAAILDANTEAAEWINAKLAERPDLIAAEIRVPTTKGRPLEWDTENETFVIVDPEPAE